MLTRPAALSDSCLVDALRDGWSVIVDALEYLPVGFGSHHWRASAGPNRWFVTVDDLDAKVGWVDEARGAAFERLTSALLSARSLLDSGLTFVVAPLRATSGEVVRLVIDRFALALYPYVAGRSHAGGKYDSLEDRLAVLQLAVAVHATPTKVCDSARTDEFLIPHRHELLRAIDDLSSSWDGGPYAEPSRSLLARHAANVERRFAHYDELADDARQRPERRVVTHGEMHVGNTILTDEGWVLVDWDTVLLAPPERDVWMLAEGERSVIDAYATATGRTVLSSTLALYRLGWDLAEIAIYIAEFRRPHERTADTEKAWTGLNHYIADPLDQ